MLSYYNVHVTKNGGKNSRFPEHHFVDDLCFLPDNVFFFNWVYTLILLTTSYT